jgi:uncharacterized phage protein (TIGR01671 family)
MFYCGFYILGFTHHPNDSMSAEQETTEGDTGMNDRFRFRLWDEVDNKMIHDVHDATSILLERVGMAVLKPAKIGFGNEAYKNASLIPMQSTGLRDKNGVLIFEGDIVEWSYDKKMTFRGVIEYHIMTLESQDLPPRHVGFIINGIDSKFGNYFTDIPFDSIIKVIGNKFQNPELLEKQ